MTSVLSVSPMCLPCLWAATPICIFKPRCWVSWLILVISHIVTLNHFFTLSGHLGSQHCHPRHSPSHQGLNSSSIWLADNRCLLLSYWWKMLMEMGLRWFLLWHTTVDLSLGQCFPNCAPQNLYLPWDANVCLGIKEPNEVDTHW